MVYQFNFRLFSQKFTHPIITNYGIWETRESIIIRLIDEDNNITWGEISPLSWFGSETIEQAESFCIQLPKKITKDIILNIPDYLPSCQFGFECALQFALQKNPDQIISNLEYSGLLPAGKQALSQITNLYEKGYKTFKWKIAVNDINEELEIFKILVSQLPTLTKLRLDANGGLTYSQAKLWLETCDHYRDKIEFIEQPLAVDRFLEMQELSNNYYTAIALDESIANLKQIEYCVQQGWPGIFVIKPAIIGSPCKLRQFMQKHPIDVVFSSVFETNIGRNAALQLASELYQNLPHHRAVGFGTHHFFQQQENWLQMLWNN